MRSRLIWIIPIHEIILQGSCRCWTRTGHGSTKVELTLKDYEIRTQVTASLEEIPNSEQWRTEKK